VEDLKVLQRSNPEIRQGGSQVTTSPCTRQGTNDTGPRRRRLLLNAMLPNGVKLQNQLLSPSHSLDLLRLACKLYELGSRRSVELFVYHFYQNYCCQVLLIGFFVS
jgi:hypothetical protein